MRSFIIYTLHQKKVAMINSRRIGWARHVEHMAKKKNPYGVLVGEAEVDWRVILKMISEEQAGVL